MIIYLIICSAIYFNDLEIMVERATWWVSPGLLCNSNDLSGYVCNMSPGGCFALRAGKKSG